MKNLFYLLILIIYCKGNSQTLEISYSLLIDMSGKQLTPFQHQYKIVNSNGLSVQKKFLIKPIIEKRIDKNKESTSFIKIGNDTTYVFKDFNQNQLFSEEKIFTKSLVVSDELNIFDWKIEKDTLTILNNKCQKATTKFRGREFVAYFTTDIPISDGPWKFNGLPGLILKIDIIDPIAVFSIQAIEIKIKNSTISLANPIDSKKAMSFNEYKKEYNLKYNEIQTFTAEQNNGLQIKKGGLEILFDE
ncbi:GLPGLI family protein [Flavobacterium sp.]